MDLGGTSVRHRKDLTLSYQLVPLYCGVQVARAYSTSDRVLVVGLLELDSLIQSVHQSDGIELGLNTLEESTKKGRGSDDL